MRARVAYRFDAGTLLMRLFTYAITIGTIATLTLSGASALGATSVSSLIALCMIFVTPRVSRQIDLRGQSAIVPGAAAIAMVGLTLMLATVQFGLPFWLNYLAAPMISFIPNAQALARTRWTYLIDTQRFGANTPTLMTAYAYEGVLEDIAFMVGPALVVALAAGITPAAGMLCGMVLYSVGAMILISSKDTEPDLGWSKGQTQDRGVGVLRTSPVVRVIFASMILFGALYGSMDTVVISYCESIHAAALSSVVFASESVCSVFMSIVFGMIAFRWALRKRYVAFTVLFGVAYALLAFVNSPVTLVVIACVSALSYAPMYITTNVTCEHAVDAAHLTEALSWIVSGNSIGMVIGPVLTGAVVDNLGTMAGFDVTASFGVFAVVLVVCCIPVLRKHLPDEPA